MTSAVADLTSINAQRKIENGLSGTMDLQIRAISVIRFETNLHRLTADLAIFNI